MWYEPNSDVNVLQVPFYDVINVSDIIDAVCLRPVPKETALSSYNSSEKLFYVNKFAQ